MLSFSSRLQTSSNDTTTSLLTRAISTIVIKIIKIACIMAYIMRWHNNLIARCWLKYLKIVMMFFFKFVFKAIDVNFDKNLSLLLIQRSLDMDEYEVYEKQIDDLIAKYRTNRDRDLYKKINHQLDMYNLFLDQNFAAQAKYEWHVRQKKLVNELKRQKDDIANKKVNGKSPQKQRLIDQIPSNKNAGVEYVQNLQEQIKKQLDRVQAGTQKAVQISTYIKLQLNRQIQLLDDVYEENKDMQSRLNRAKKGLIVILRRVMLNKCTKFLVVILVLAVIALIVLYALKSRGVISL